MTITPVVAVFLLLATSFLVWKLTNKKSAVALHALLLALTPWMLVLLIKQPSLKPRASLLSASERISANLSFLSSGEFLFFQGDGRPGFGTGDHGAFLLSALPLILLGAYIALSEKDTTYALPLWWLLGGLSIATLLGRVAGLPAALWFLPALSTLVTIGATTGIGILFSKKTTVFTKVLLVLLFSLFLFESLRLYHVILIHQAFIG